ncbi:MAG: hypothetical protein M9941_19875 [Anaerolineae bacterium]|nr:hypothetical protein [Anaerolineae bacterium]MCO5195441.1 hypothetical protein [Anaerolineae bacterium]MCO5200001.1 hypothetical protein [Anaerolineae bacterium]
MGTIANTPVKKNAVVKISTTDDVSTATEYQCEIASVGPSTPPTVNRSEESSICGATVSIEDGITGGHNVPFTAFYRDTLAAGQVATPVDLVMIMWDAAENRTTLYMWVFQMGEVADALGWKVVGIPEPMAMPDIPASGAFKFTCNLYGTVTPIQSA